MNEDTIVAIASPPGTGAISVIRISGENSISAADQIFKGKQKLADSESHRIHYGDILDGEKHLDDVLVSVFRKPNSYTGEDSVEISTHGNPFITQKIIELLLKTGVRNAEPGEFTKRAFLNEKLDLSQAEAVADVIGSRTEASLRGARNQLDGLLSKEIAFLRDELINATSFVELELDFAEEDVEFVDKSELTDRIKKIIKRLHELLKTYSFGRVIRDGVNVSLVGKPNVGKSSILNYILKESRSIVSSIPGTTRDVIREEVSIDGILFRLYDTAGIRISEDEIEKEGVLRSREAVKNSDLILLINDTEQEFSKDLFEELKNISDEKKIISIQNKIDLKENNDNRFDVNVSAKTGEGMEELFRLLKEKSLGEESYSECSAVISSGRHYNCLSEAKQSLEHSLKSVDQDLSGEFISVDLRNAANNLGEIIGEVTSDDILNNIFTKFCIGK